MATRTKETIDISKSLASQGYNYCTMQLSNSCKNKNGFNKISNFYTSNNEFYFNGRFNICKDCLKEYVYLNGEINVNNFKQILRIYNLPFFKKEWESALEDNNETIGTYMKNIHLNHKNQTWLDGDVIDNSDEDLINNGINYDKTLIARWGYGFSPQEINWLEQDYYEWITHHDADKLSVQRLIQMICIKELEIRNARQAGKPTDKLEKSLRELMNDASLTPKTMSAMNETDSEKTFGLWLKDIQQYKPTEYFEDKSIYEDYDNIKDYFDRFVLRPMKNLITGSRDFDQEFNVEDSNEGDSDE